MEDSEVALPPPLTFTGSLERLPDPLSFDLPRATFLLLQQIGIIPSIEIILSAHRSQLIQEQHNSIIVQRALINIQDAALLLSILPSSLLPELPFTASKAPSVSAATRARVLDTLARLALEPSLTILIMRRFRPLATHFWGRWLEMLGIDTTTGEFKRPSTNEMEVDETEQELFAVQKVYRAMIAVTSVYENCFPFLQCLLKHPLLSNPFTASPTASASELSIPLLTLHSLLHTLPFLPNSSLTNWSFPPTIEVIMKSHPHRGTRLLAWRILRKWYNLYAGLGEDLREKWVWQSNLVEGTGLAPLPSYPVHYKEEYDAEFGPWTGQANEVDLVPGFGEELVGTAKFIEGGVQVDVMEKSVDVWLLPVMEDTRATEERSNLARIQPIPVDWISEEQDSAFISSRGIGKITAKELSAMVVMVEGYLLFREGLIPSMISIQSTLPSKQIQSTTPTADTFVRTPATTVALRSLALHLQRRLPVLLSSPPSAGKASVIQHLWNLLHSLPTGETTEQGRKRELVVINLADRSLDSKSLLGSLSSAPSTSESEAGTFVFVEGPLTRAVRQGRWVVLTSIDQASVEVLSVIKVLAERMKRTSESSIGGAWGGGAGEEDGGVGVRVEGGSGRWVRAGKGFMLFSTRSVEATTSPIDSGRPSEATFFGSHYFSETWMAPPNNEEVGMIVQGRYPRLSVGDLGSTLINVWENVRKVDVREGGAGTGRAVGVRDLLRWCRRVEELLPRDVEIKSIASNPILQEEIYTEARDVFLGSLPLPPYTAVALGEARDRYSVIAFVMAEGLSLSAERAEHVLRRRDPDCSVPKIDEEDGKLSTAQHYLKMGRVSLPFRKTRLSHDSRPYALTKPSRIVLEKLAVCLRLSEPVLMVGETGTGKTAAVGHLAELMGKRLTALNLSNQTEAGDLVGGFKPIDEVAEAKRTASELFNRSLELMSKTQSQSSYTAYKKQAESAFRTTSEKKNWRKLVAHWRSAARVAIEKLTPKDSPPPIEIDPTSTDGPRKRRKVDLTLANDWTDFLVEVEDFETRHILKASKNKFVFSFVEGPLAKAIRSGDWVLLDEVNLASPETLESLSTLLQGPNSSLILTEQGDLEPIPRHPEFRLFACMNPATDVGKRDLPAGLRAKFSEIWVPPPDADREALVAIITGYIGRCAAGDLGVIANVADLYSSVKNLAISAQLADGSNQPPHYSMRTLARALTFANDFSSTFGIRRALYEGFLMSFTMLLDVKSSTLVKTLIEQNIVKGRLGAFTRDPPAPSLIDPSQLIKFGSYWLETGPEPLQEPRDYILTPSVQLKVLDLARAVLTRKVPVLIQGPTSSGKTSVVEYLAKRTGHRFVRINNHEHTDIQEYIGTYVSDTASGQLVFQEGLLVRALRQGDWIVLDELNLAPTDVLEALNRLLDDNRELVIPETGEVVRPHPHFMLFATQNPPGLYGGRKVLSRAFRNRFLEMHFGDVPKEELETILCQRCEIAPSYAKKTVAVFLELQRRRQAGRVFEQKNAFATLRDLFRWGGRGSVGYQQLAEDGYMLLAERARKVDDKAVVKEVIEQEMNVAIDETTLYDFSRLAASGLPEPPATVGLVWTSAMRRLYYLLAAGLHRNEPVLLVGETGSGKTSVCQSLALALDTELHIIGCHQNTETADLLGGQRPLRNRAAIQSVLRTEAVDFLKSLAQPTPLESDDFETIIVSLEEFEKVADKSIKENLTSLIERMRGTTALFEWHDGPLVQAMHSGDLILLDEISLADDSVLERLNSVLEPSRTLVLAEKGGRDLSDIRIIGAEGFQILATMNPGGDFGKKELSPALRNRFTEIWVPLVDDYEDLLHIIKSRWTDSSLEIYGPKILEFGKWFGEAVGLSGGLGIGLRDILAWVDFLNIALSKQSLQELSSTPRLDIGDAFCQGALMTVVDGMGALPSTSGLAKEPLHKLRYECWRKLESLVEVTIAPENISLEVAEIGTGFYIGSFGVSKGPLPPASADFTLQAPTTRLNAMRLLRALQLTKPVLLEGSPGVGKTSLVTAIASATGHNLVRINLSDQTDLMDLLGSDLPVEGGRSGEFAWKDAPFLAAMQEGSWVLLDEMNLASQSILEGLNSCLDHRGTVYIPELDRTFTRHPEFRIFAAQNPLGQGGGRKGLPKSFLDRFSLVHMEELNSIDLNSIASTLYPEFDPTVLEKMISFNSSIHRQSMESRSFGLEGAPWEFNLRDVLRWLALLRTSSSIDLQPGQAVEYAGLLYLQRFRTLKDRTHVARLFMDAFGQELDPALRPYSSISSRNVQVGHSVVTRSDSLLVGRQHSIAPLLQRSLQPLEALTKCFDMGWLAILTGSRACGKTTLVRQLASLRGKSLREFSMSAEVDTLELLGSFEQAERFRVLDRIAEHAIILLEHSIRQQLHLSTVNDVHRALDTLIQLRLALSASGSGYNLLAASVVVSLALELVVEVESAEAKQNLINQLEIAGNTSGPQARFEWIDGPLVSAMKTGQWLLIEDANLCSPSVLDRLNSLFEPGGRLQLAERGPVDGEIQIIYPHPEFRLVMTLDPRHGELSRAMRNRGIEIALLESSIASTEDNRRLTNAARVDSETTTSESLLIASSKLHQDVFESTPYESILKSDAINEPGLATVIDALNVTLEDVEATGTLARHLLSAIASSHYALTIRFLRAVQLLEDSRAEAAIRNLERHHLLAHIDETKKAVATEAGISSELVLLQSSDLALTPHSLTTDDRSARLSLSNGLDTLAALSLSATANPESLRLISSKPVKTLNVWEKSLLASHGRLRGDDTDPAIKALFPAMVALGSLISQILSAQLLSFSMDERNAAIKSAKDVQLLSAELEQVCRTTDLDFSSVQHIASWIAEAIHSVPHILVDPASDARTRLAPLQNSLILTTGKEMAAIWRACLPYRPASDALAATYTRLLSRGDASAGEVWDPAVVDLFLEVAVMLGVARPQDSLADESGVAELVENILLRLPLPVEEIVETDPSLRLTIASNLSSLSVTELAAVASVFVNTADNISASTFVKVAQASGIVALSSIVPVHQLVSWPVENPEVARLRSSVEFKTLLGWAERLALGADKKQHTMDRTIMIASPADIVRPTILRATTALRTTDTSSLGNLIVLSESMWRSSRLQVLTAAADSVPRISALRSALLAAISLTASNCIVDGTTDRDTSSLLTLTDGSSYTTAFQEAVQLYLSPTLAALAANDITDLKSVGEGFVGYSRSLWHLYVPNIPLDPAVGLRAHTQFLKRQLASVTKLYEAFKDSESKSSGNASNIKMDILRSELESLQRALDTAGVLPVSRAGDPALLAGLFRELRSFREQIISDGQLDGLLEELGQVWTPEIASREANLQYSVENLLRRLDAAYSQLDDILGPVRLSLCCLKIGFSLLLHVARCASIDATTSPFAVLLQDLAKFPTAAHATAIQAIDLPLTIKIGAESIIAPSRATLLQIASLTSQLSTNSVFDRDALRRLTQLYDRMHYLWTADRRREEEAAREAESLYKAKTDIQQIASDEELEAQEFALLFPTFEDIPDKDSIPITESATAPAKIPKLLQPADQAQLAKLHVGLFVTGGDFASECATDYETLRGNSITSLLPSLFDTMNESLDRASAAYRIRTLVDLSQAAAPTNGIEPVLRDFYNEPDVRETAKAVPILLALSTRLAGLIETFPEQMVLQNLRERCEATLALSSKSSVAQVLTAIEALLVHTEDWESYASREHSIVISRTAITNLIVEWRRLELTCWSRLLSTVQDHFGDPVASWWFRFYETTIRGAPGVDSDADAAASQTPAEYYCELVSILDSFLATSSLGQYGTRLELVLSFARLAAKLGEEGPTFESMQGAASLRTVSRLMLNIHGFYDQYSPRVKSFLLSERARIDKDVQNLIKLASWKDVNVYALKQSAIRSHHQLYKSVRKLRAVLQKPASDFFTIPEFDRSLAVFISIPAVIVSEKNLPSIPESLATPTDATHIIRLDQTLNRLESLVTVHLDPFITLDRATLVDELAVQIITTAKSLKDESVPGEEEGRNARVKALATRKRRAWIELLRELRRLGLSHTPTPETVKRLQDSGVVYALPASRDLVGMDSVLLLDSIRAQLLKADDYHFRLLSEMPALRDCPAEHNQDISTREIQRAIGSFESCIALGFENRTQIINTIASHVRFEAMIGRLEQISKGKEIQPQQHSRYLAESLLDHVSQVIAALKETRQELANHQLALRINSVEVSKVDIAVAQALTTLVGDQDNLLEVLASMVSFDMVLSSPADLIAFGSARKNLLLVAETLRITICPPSLVYLIGPLSTWINSLEIPVLQVESDLDSTLTEGLEILKVDHTTLIDSILIIAQELRKLAIKDVPTDEGGDLPDLGIKITSRAFQETLAVFRLPQMQEQVDSFVRHAHTTLASSNSIESVTILLLRVVPFLRHYSSIIGRQLAAFLEWHKASLKLAYVLASVVKQLSLEGFCRPSEDDGDAGEDSKTTDGTGMADGKGATNVSNEIEDEEQIEGLQGEVPEKEKDEQKEGDDDAVEMKDDFEGEMEDRGDGEKEDDDKSDDEEKDEDEVDPEEQIADVDPLDPSSVDEKFWGDEESKDSGSNEEINQETTKSAGESEMAAKEDEAPAPKPKGEDSGEGESKEEEQTDKPPPEDGQELEGEGEIGDEEANNDEEGNEDDVKPEDGQDGEEEDGEAAQQEDGQRLDDKMPEADNLDLPDDMQLDGDDKKEEDDLDLGDDMDDLGEDEQEVPEHDIEDTGDANEEMNEDAQPTETFPEGEAPEPAPEDAPELDQSLGGADQGQNGGEGAQDSASSMVPETAAAESSIQPGAEAEKGDEEEEKEGQDKEEEKDGQADENDAMDDDSDPSLTAPSNAADGQTKQRSSAADPTSDPSKPRPNQPSPSEPQRSLGDALQSWKRRLEAISDLEEAEPDATEPEKLAIGEEDGEVEFVQDGDEKDEDAQALGPASEEQVKGLENLNIAEEDTQQTFEPDSMDVDQANVDMLAPQSTIQLDGSNAVDSDAKAIPAEELRLDRSNAEADQPDEMDIERAEEEEDPSTTLASPHEAPTDESVEQTMLQWRSGEEEDLTADGVWRLYESLTRDLSYALTEQLRLILEPTLANRLKGDFNSGKRLNMKKIIPYIASEFTKNKIWLRRQKASGREYQIMIAIDDSKSMSDSHSVHLAYQSLALITRALTRLEVGGVAICRFGDTMDVLHSFESGPVSDEAGAKLLGQFTFSQRSTDVRLLVEKSLNYLAMAKDQARAKASLAAGDLWQLQIIISDGICQDQEKLRALLRRGTEQKVMFVFVVIDSLHRRATDSNETASDINQNSILSMKQVSYVKGANGNLELQMVRYLDTFPFDNFIVLRDSTGLPEALSSTLRQFLEKVSSDR